MEAKPNRINAKWYPALGAVVVGTIGLGVGGLWLSPWVPRLPASPTRFNALPTPGSDSSVLASPAPQVSSQVSPIAPSRASNPPDSVAIANRQGVLRISNPTEYPVRVALLAKSPSTPNPNSNSDYDIPAHWDFAPQEGSDRGLIVSLPDRGVRLSKGDILVAFAQDGSRRYWGPYVVGETTIPVWNPKVAEWQLTLQP